jgi:hypothetical protein
LEILRNLEALQFTKEDFLEAMKKCQSHLTAEDKPELVLRHLFEFSVIGYLMAGGRGGGADYIWRYRDPTSKFADSATSFRVHPGFRDVLRLKKFTRSERGKTDNFDFEGLMKEAEDVQERVLEKFNRQLRAND